MIFDCIATVNWQPFWKALCEPLTLYVTKHKIDWDSAECVTYSTNYQQRLTLESWYTNSEKEPLNRCQQLPAPYERPRALQLLIKMLIRLCLYGRGLSFYTGTSSLKKIWPHLSLTWLALILNQIDATFPSFLSQVLVRRFMMINWEQSEYLDHKCNLS